MHNVYIPMHIINMYNYYTYHFTFKITIKAVRTCYTHTTVIVLTCNSQHGHNYTGLSILATKKYLK